MIVATHILITNAVYPLVESVITFARMAKRILVSFSDSCQHVTIPHQQPSNDGCNTDRYGDNPLKIISHHCPRSPCRRHSGPVHTCALHSPAAVTSILR